MTKRPNLAAEAASFLDALAAANLPSFHGGSPQQARDLVAALRPDLTYVTPVAEIADHAVEAAHGSVPVRIYRPSATPEAALLYIHGGGWVLGSVEQSDSFVRDLAIATNCVVVSVDYRLAPEAPFSAAIDDCRAALEWMAGTVAGELPLVVMGESAGGNLAAVVAAGARDAGGPALAGQILVYPVTDAAMDTASYNDFADDLLLPAATMAWFWDHYSGGADRLDPCLSPLRGDCAGLPPAFILTAEYDVLRDEGEALAAALSTSGVPVRCKRYDGQIHSFLSMLRHSGGARRAMADIAGFIGEITKN